MNNNHLVDFPPHGRFWLLLDDSGEGPLAPLHHCDANGEVTLDAALGGTSFAHMYASGEIVRYGAVIGNRRDLAVHARRRGQGDGLRK
jgi:hypothetical protein